MKPSTLSASILTLTIAVVICSTTALPTATRRSGSDVMILRNLIQNYITVSTSKDCEHVRAAYQSTIDSAIWYKVYQMQNKCQQTNPDSTVMDSIYRVTCVIRENLSGREQVILILFATLYAVVLILSFLGFMVLLGAICGAAAACFLPEPVKLGPRVVASKHPTYQRVTVAATNRPKTTNPALVLSPTYKATKASIV